MLTNPVGKLVFVIFLSLAIAPVPRAGQRMRDQGDIWFTWNQTERENYVYGYTSGYYHGFGNSCLRSVEDLHFNSTPPQPGPHKICMDGDKQFFRGNDDPVDLIDDFYTRYPDVHDISPAEVLDLIGDGLSLEQIHKYPFMRHDPPAN